MTGESSSFVLGQSQVIGAIGNEAVSRSQSPPQKKQSSTSKLKKFLNEAIFQDAEQPHASFQHQKSISVHSPVHANRAHQRSLNDQTNEIGSELSFKAACIRAQDKEQGSRSPARP